MEIKNFSYLNGITNGKTKILAYENVESGRIDIIENGIGFASLIYKRLLWSLPDSTVIAWLKLFGFNIELKKEN